MAREADRELKLTLGALDERFTDPNATAEYLASIRSANGVVCPKCGESEREPYRLKGQKRRLWKCRACRKQFTVTVGTIFESSPYPSPQVAARLLPALLLEEGDERPSAPPYARRHLQDGLVHVPPRPRGHERPGLLGQAIGRRRGRRDLRRRQAQGHGDEGPTAGGRP